MDAALSYLSARMRTVREVEDKLDDLQYGEGDILVTVERLKELNLLNDEEYAREFVRSRLASKPVSRQKLYLDLKNHKGSPRRPVWPLSGRRRRKRIEAHTGCKGICAAPGEPF